MQVLLSAVLRRGLPPSDFFKSAIHSDSLNANSQFLPDALPSSQFPAGSLPATWPPDDRVPAADTAGRRLFCQHECFEHRGNSVFVEKLIVA